MGIPLLGQETTYSPDKSLKIANGTVASNPLQCLRIVRKFSTRMRRQLLCSSSRGFPTIEYQFLLF
jgi:hypothetical protein